MLVKWFNRLTMAYFLIGTAIAAWADWDNLNLVTLWNTEVDYPLNNLVTIVQNVGNLLK